MAGTMELRFQGEVIRYKSWNNANDRNRAIEVWRRQCGKKWELTELLIVTKKRLPWKRGQLMKYDSVTTVTKNYNK